MRGSAIQNEFMTAQAETETDVVTCTIESKPSKAQYYLSSVHEVYQLFSLLTENTKHEV